MIPRVAHPRPGRAWIVAGVLLVPRLLAGQVPTGEGFTDRSLLPRAEIDQAIAESRFRLGPAYLTPVIAITQATYDGNVSGTGQDSTGDFLATISAGLGLILPLEKNFFVQAGAVPSYTWYAQLQNRRYWGGKYGGSFSIFANRLTVQGSADYSKQDVIFSSELQQRVVQELDSLRLDAEYRVLNRLYLYGEGRLQRFRYTGPSAEFVSLDPSTTDRTTWFFRGEVRYRPSENVRIGVAYDETRAEFVSLPQQYDNVIRSGVGSVYYDREKFFVSASAGYSEGSPTHGSTVPPFSGFLGSGSVSYALLRRLNIQAFAGRDLSYGLTTPYYVSTRYGAGVAVRVGWRLNLQGSAFLGTDSYSTRTFVPEQGSVYRLDDVKGYGGGLNFLFTSRIQMQFLATEYRYNSNVAGNDRSNLRWVVSLNFEGNLLK